MPGAGGGSWPTRTDRRSPAAAVWLALSPLRRTVIRGAWPPHFMGFRRVRLGALLLVFLAGLTGLPAEDGEEGSSRERPSLDAIRLRQLSGVESAAVRRGLGYLRVQVNPSGSIGRKYPVAVTAVSGLAFMAGGHGYSEGPYAEVIRSCLRYILDNMDSTGFIHEGQSGQTVRQGDMHGHCFALLFLTQIYGELPATLQPSVRDAIARAISRTVQGQSTRGGWDYSPDNSLANADEASITIGVLQALRGARNAGFHVEPRVIQNAMRYVRECHNAADGSFSYSLSRNKSESTFSLTAAAVSTIQAAGAYDSPLVRSGLDFLRMELDRVSWRPRRAVNEPFFFYGALYASEAFFQVGGGDWERWNRALRAQLLREQKDDGGWEDDYGKEFGTAMAVLMLEIPLQYLPIFQR